MPTKRFDVGKFRSVMRWKSKVEWWRNMEGENFRIKRGKKEPDQGKK